MWVRADKRSRDVVASPQAEKTAKELQSLHAETEIKVAKALATLEKNHSYVLANHVSIRSWAEAHGYDPGETRRLLALGRALISHPDLDRKVRSGRVSRENAVIVGQVFSEPELKLTAKERKAWMERASTTSSKVLRDQAERAIEKARQGAATIRMSFLVRKEARDSFRRVRQLMSKGRPRLITEGMAFGRLVKDWRAHNDPQLKPLPRRRSGPTKGGGSRRRPRQVDALVERRSDGMCEFCRERRATHKIHLTVPHAKGGSREADNIGDACATCHVWVDAGVIVVTGFDEQGGLVWKLNPDRLRDQVCERGPGYAGFEIAPSDGILTRTEPIPFG
ncbi:MAG: hypothetical protein ACYTEZ_16170 [Planctomycetota bacterium]|jgi:hypothetical protein